MRRGWLIFTLVLLVLCALATVSSKRPDAVQRLIGLPGGVERYFKSVGGVLVTVMAMMALITTLKALKK